jgi:hypothetical protein
VSGQLEPEQIEFLAAMTDLEWCRIGCAGPLNKTYSQYLDAMPGQNLHVIVI